MCPREEVHNFALPWRVDLLIFVDNHLDNAMENAIKEALYDIFNVEARSYTIGSITHTETSESELENGVADVKYVDDGKNHNLERDYLSEEDYYHKEVQDVGFDYVLFVGVFDDYYRHSRAHLIFLSSCCLWGIFPHFLHLEWILHYYH